MNEETSNYLSDPNNWTGWASVLNDFNIDEMLGKYGPEGCFVLAYALQNAAHKDMSDGMAEATKDISNGYMLRDASERFGIPYSQDDHYYRHCVNEIKKHRSKLESNSDPT